MEKRLYNKPLMSMEQFTPSEYVSLCWYVKSGDCYQNLYHDTQTTTIWAPTWTNPIATKDIYGFYNNGEALQTNHGSHRVPAETSNWFKADALPQPITNDGKYYTGYSNTFYNVANGWLDQYTGNVTGKIYLIEHNGTKHYYKEPTKDGGHS